MVIDKLKVLLVVNPARTDFYKYLEGCEAVDFYILWYVKKNDETNIELPAFIKKQYYWSEFRTPFSLFKKISPNKIVFFEIIDLRQIALIVASKLKKITTIYLEHGAAGDRATAIKRWTEEKHIKNKIPYLLNRIKRESIDIFDSKFFYYSVFPFLKRIKLMIDYGTLPFKMLGGLPNKVLSNSRFRERVPDYAITFNRANFEEFELYTGIDEKDVLFTGIPFFDKFYRNQLEVENYVVYIDTPFIDEGLLNWTEEHNARVAHALYEFALRNNTKIYIKLHPLSSRERWDNYGFNSELFEIIQFGDFTELYLKAKLILGYSSSLITGFLSAKKNIVILGWHPEPSIFGADFSSTGICHSSLQFEDLDSKYIFWTDNNLTLRENDEYISFLKRFNYPFDGKATERVLNSIRELNKYDLK